LAKEYHPDVNKSAGAKEKFAEINEAYETLGDE
jgi:molecular chaperone DnaJ